MGGEVGEYSLDMVQVERLLFLLKRNDLCTFLCNFPKTLNKFRIKCNHLTIPISDTNYVYVLNMTYISHDPLFIKEEHLK